MPRETVKVDFEETEVENDEGRAVLGLRARCTRCDETVEVYGQSDASKRRACVMLRDACDESDGPFYYTE
jgi:hypothetical protein